MTPVRGLCEKKHDILLQDKGTVASQHAGSQCGLLAPERGGKRVGCRKWPEVKAEGSRARVSQDPVYGALLAGEYWQAILRSGQGYSQIRGLARGLLLDTEGQNEWEKAGGLEVRPGPEGVTGEEWASV